MSLLKSVGSVVLKIVGLWPKVAPLVAMAIPGASEIGGIANILFSTEQLFTSAFGPGAKKGSDKLRAATPQVAQLIQASSMFQGKAIKDEALAEKAFTAITSDFADLLNAYGE
jgi:hypothetical protein